jgi:hypothetical protein
MASLGATSPKRTLLCLSRRDLSELSRVEPVFVASKYGLSFSIVLGRRLNAGVRVHSRNISGTALATIRTAETATRATNQPMLHLMMTTWWVRVPLVVFSCICVWPENKSSPTRPTFPMSTPLDMTSLPTEMSHHVFSNCPRRCAKRMEPMSPGWDTGKPAWIARPGSSGYAR